MNIITNTNWCGNPSMSGNPDSRDIATDHSESGNGIADTLLTADVEPTADGGERALLYPADRSGAELSTRWIAARTTVLVDLSDFQ